MSYSCSTRVRNRDWLVDIAAELPSSWHHCKFAEAVEISYIFLPLSSLERTFVVTRSRVQVYSMWTFAGALQSLSGNGKTLNQWRPNKNTQTPSQALSYCRRCAHGMLVSKGALCCFLPSFCFDTSNTSMKLVYNTDRPWDSLSDFAETSSLHSCSWSGVMPSRSPEKVGYESVGVIEKFGTQERERERIANKWMRAWEMCMPCLFFFASWSCFVVKHLSAICFLGVGPQLWKSRSFPSRNGRRMLKSVWVAWEKLPSSLILCLDPGLQGLCFAGPAMSEHWKLKAVDESCVFYKSSAGNAFDGRTWKWADWGFQGATERSKKDSDSQ